MYILLSLVLSAANVMATVVIVWLANRKHSDDCADSGMSSCESVPLFVRVLVIDVLGTIVHTPAYLLARAFDLLLLCGLPCLWCRTDATDAKHQRVHQMRRLAIQSALRALETKLMHTFTRRPAAPAADGVANSDEKSAGTSASAAAGDEQKEKQKEKEKPKQTKRSVAAGGKPEENIPLVALNPLSSTTRSTQSPAKLPVTQAEMNQQLVAQLDRLNAHLEYVSLKQLFASSSSCYFIPPPEQLVASGVGASGEDAELGAVDKATAVRLLVPHRRATWAQVAQILNRLWGVLYLVASLLVFSVYLGPLLFVGIRETVRRGGMSHENRTGC